VFFTLSAPNLEDLERFSLFVKGLFYIKRITLLNYLKMRVESKEKSGYNKRRKGEIHMKKQISIIAAALLAALPGTGYAAGCAHKATNDFGICVNNSCFSEVVKSEKAKDLIDSILSGKPISGFSNIAEIIDAWLEEQTSGNTQGTDKPVQKPVEKPEADNAPTDEPETENDSESIIPPEQNEKPDNQGNNSVSGSVENAAFVNEVIRLVNIERNKAGLASLSTDTSLNKASSTRAKEIVKSFSHTRPDGRSCFTALSDIGYSYSSAGENIAYGQSSPASVVNAWMNSEGHRANILSAKYTKIGVGCHSNGGTYYWAQFFAG